MPFGLRNAPATFVKLMEQVLRGLLFKKFIIYLDDIIVYTDTPEKHLRRLRNVFERLKQYQVKMKPSKCFLTQEKYLGHIMDKHGVSPISENTKAIMDVTTTFNNVTGVHQFFGMVSYYRRFIPNFATISKPLRLCQP